MRTIPKLVLAFSFLGLGFVSILGFQWLTKTRGIGETPSPTPIGATEVTTFIPRERPKRQLVGECLSPANDSSAETALRCSSGNEALDPCFLFGENEVICVPDPITNDPGILLSLPKGLPKQIQARQSQRLWILELENNMVCHTLPGTLPLVNNIPYHYSCTSEAGDRFYGSEVKRSSPLFEIDLATEIEKTNTSIKTVKVVRAWK